MQEDCLLKWSSSGRLSVGVVVFMEVSGERLFSWNGSISEGVSREFVC